jgi:hypothetical protein
MNSYFTHTDGRLSSDDFIKSISTGSVNLQQKGNLINYEKQNRLFITLMMLLSKLLDVFVV